MRDAEVIIIGAGAAGLAAAEALSDAGVDALILEARDRIGGRVHTVVDDRFPLPVELGAEFIHGTPGSTMDVLRRSGVMALEIPEDRSLVKEGRIIHDRDAFELDPVTERLEKLGRRDMSFAEFLRTRCAAPSLRRARAFARAFVEGFDAADTHDISARSLAQEQQGVGNVSEERQFRPLGGYGALMKFLARDAHARLSTRVTRIGWAPRRVTVSANAGRKLRSYHAARAIVTLPVGLLRARGAVEFEPEVPAIRSAAALLGPGAIVKVILAFREPFWERLRKDKPVGFIQSPGEDIPTWWTPFPIRAPMLTGWAGGPVARRLAAAGGNEGGLIGAALSSLSRTLGRRRATLERLLTGARAADWAHDPFTMGAYSYVRVGGDGARQTLARPVAGTLFFAGEATDTTGQAATVAGAIASGRRAAAAVLRTL